MSLCKTDSAPFHVTTGRRWYAFVGSQTSGSGEGISVFPYDPSNGEWGQRCLLLDADNPSFLEVDEQRSVLYAVRETETYVGVEGGAVAAYTLESEKTGCLDARLLCEAPSEGTYPCHLIQGPGGNSLFVSNYGDGVLSVFALDAQGRFAAPARIFRYRGTGPNVERQECAHVHSVAVRGAYALAADLGRDRIIVHTLDPATYLPPESGAGETALEGGAGPRHFAFHPDGKTLYVSEELKSRVSVLRWEESSGHLRCLQTLSTLPGDYRGMNLAADIHAHPGGGFVYCSNRGHDSIVSFSVREGSGLLDLVGHTPCGGSWPRQFAVDPTGTRLFVANSRSNSVDRLRIDIKSGLPLPVDRSVRVGEPMCVRFASFPQA